MRRMDFFACRGSEFSATALLVLREGGDLFSDRMTNPCTWLLSRKFRRRSGEFESFPVSPCTRSETFSELTGYSIYLKLENRHRTGAYKERGALNKLLTLSTEERSQE